MNEAKLDAIVARLDAIVWVVELTNPLYKNPHYCKTFVGANVVVKGKGSATKFNDKKEAEKLASQWTGGVGSAGWTGKVVSV